MSVPYVNPLLVVSSAVLYVRDIHKETRSCLFLLLLLHTPRQTAITRAIQHHRWWNRELMLPGARKENKPKCPLWMCACNSNSTKSKGGNLEQNTVELKWCAQGTGRLFTFLLYLIAEGLSSPLNSIELTLIKKTRSSSKRIGNVPYFVHLLFLVLYVRIQLLAPMAEKCCPAQRTMIRAG